MDKDISLLSDLLKRKDRFTYDLRSQFQVYEGIVCAYRATPELEHFSELTFVIAHAKAYTAAIMKRPARDLLHWAESEPVYFNQVAQMGHQPIVATQGGMPVRPGSEIVGGIGVSGGTPEQDQACCEAALLAIEAPWQK